MATRAFGFGGKNVAAQKAAKAHAAKMVKNVSAETKRAIRAIVASSVRGDVSPVEAAKRIRGVIGLDVRRAKAVENFRAGLVELGLSPDRVKKRVEMYAARKLRERSIDIVRTEVVGALNAGAKASWIEAQRKGLLGRDARKQIVVSEDERTCPVCAPLDGQTALIKEPFETANGAIDMPPFHVRCRCGVVVVPGK